MSTKASQDTALRNITDLVERGILVRDPGGGGSTSYSLRRSSETGGDVTAKA
jgi:Fic family protein